MLASWWMNRCYNYCSGAWGGDPGLRQLSCGSLRRCCSAGNVPQLQSDSSLLMSAPFLWQACTSVASSPVGWLQPMLSFPRTDGVKGSGAFMPEE